MGLRTNGLGKLSSIDPQNVISYNECGGIFRVLTNEGRNHGPFAKWAARKTQ